MDGAVNALCPGYIGYIQTAMWTEVMDRIVARVYGIPAERVFQEFIQRQTFLKREQTPEEIRRLPLPGGPVTLEVRRLQALAPEYHHWGQCTV